MPPLPQYQVHNNAEETKKGRHEVRLGGFPAPPAGQGCQAQISRAAVVPRASRTSTGTSAPAQSCTQRAASFPRWPARRWSPGPPSAVTVWVGLGLPYVSNQGAPRHRLTRARPDGGNDAQTTRRCHRGVGSSRLQSALPAATTEEKNSVKGAKAAALPCAQCHGLSRLGKSFGAPAGAGGRK